MLVAFQIFVGVEHLAAQPAVDHHLHLLRSANAPPQGSALKAADLIRQMDEAGVRRGVVLSIAYQFGNPFRPPVANEYARVKEENDWTATQAGFTRIAWWRVAGSIRWRIMRCKRSTAALRIPGFDEV